MTSESTDMFDDVSADQAQEVPAAEPITLEMIGEGKKYRSIEEADKALLHKETHIQKIERENAELREKLLKTAAIDDALKYIKTKPTSATEEAATPAMPSPEELETTAAKLVEQKFKEVENKKTSEANKATVRDALVKQFGSKAKEVYEAKARELNLNLDELAVKSPQAVLSFFGAKTDSSANSANTSSVNTAALENTRVAVNTYDYWNELRKAGKISVAECSKQQHIWLQQLGPEKFYGKK